eukprot:s227_g12.t1
MWQTRKSLAFMPEWSHVDTVTLTELPPFTVGTKLAAPFAANDQHIPCYARILRVTTIPGSEEGGDVSSQEPKTQVAFGVPWSEEGFIEEAIRRGHPANLFDGLSKCLRTAISNSASESCEAMILRRAQWFRKWTSRAFELRAEEQALHEKLPTYRQNILKGKRFLVLREMLAEMNYPEPQIVQDMQDGFDLVGTADGGGILPAEFQPAILTVEDLSNHSWRSNQAIYHSTKSSGDDHLAVKESSLKSARLAVFCPEDRSTRCFQQYSLPFGAKASVVAFRLAHQIDLATTCYFDDYVCLTPEPLAGNSEKSFELLLDLLGWEFDRSGDKSDMSEQVAALGAVFKFNLEATHEGVTTVANTEKRKADISEQIAGVLADGRITSVKAASLKGRLGFAEGQLFGRAIRRLVNELGQHALHPPARGRLLERLGAVLIDQSGRVLKWFGCAAPKPLCDSFMAENQEQAIGELGALAVLVAYRLWAPCFQSKHVICFLDNEGSRYLILKGYSSNKVLESIVHEIALCEEEQSVLAWYARGPTEANIADHPSRSNPHPALQLT